MTAWIKWIGSAFLLTGTLMLALEVGDGFPARIVGDLLWIAAAYRMKDVEVGFLLTSFLVIDAIGFLT